MAHLTASTYADLINIVPVGSTRIIGNNTKASTYSESLAGSRNYVVDVRLHGHSIITLARGDWAEFSMCGYGTVTTRERLNHFLVPLGFRVSQNKGEQVLTRLSDGISVQIDPYGRYVVQTDGTASIRWGSPDALAIIA